MKDTFKIFTLGCKTNKYESEAILCQLEKLGWKEGENPQLCIINTCCVTKGAEKDSLYLLRQIKKKYSKALTVVTGCFSEKIKDIFLDEGIVYISNKEKEKLIEKIFPKKFSFPPFQVEKFSSHTRAFVKIQDGCNCFCSYCIIPYVRGKSRSRPKEEIIKEIKVLVANGKKEIVLTGIDIGDFRIEGKKGLAKLIRDIEEIEGLKKLRLSSINPNDIDDDLIDSVTEGEKFGRNMHISLQAGSDKMLQKMKRNYTSRAFLNVLEKFIKKNEDFTFSTDIIVGFPGETRKDFEDTLKIVKEAQFLHVHIFPYSRREKTHAFSLPDQIDTKVIKKRKKELFLLAKEISFRVREKFVGRKMSLLIENKKKKFPNFFFGHTENFLPVFLSSKNLVSNTNVEVKLVENKEFGLLGKVLKNL